MGHNTWIHKVARVCIVRPLLATSVTPNQLTAVRLALGLAAAGTIAFGSSDVAGILFVISMVFDRADGDLARLGGCVSPSGHLYDLLADSICNALIFISLGFGLRFGIYGHWATGMGILAGFSIASVLFLVLRIEASLGPRAAELDSFSYVDFDDAMLAVPLALWFGLAEQLLVAAAIGAPLFTLYFFWKFRQQVSGTQPD
jgi:archaetidylinositol phosphate synthase